MDKNTVLDYWHRKINNKQRPKEFRASLSLLAQSTLKPTGGQPCLRSILTPYHLKIHSHLPRLSRLRLVYINLRQLNFLEITNGPAQSLNSASLIPITLAQFKRNCTEGVKMRFRLIEGGLEESSKNKITQNLAKIEQVQKKSSQIYASRKEFTLEFIQRHKIKLDNLSQCAEFKLLSKAEKDNVRYHLKRMSGGRSSNPTPVSFKSKQKKPSRPHLSLLTLLAPIIAVEFAVCALAKEFYLGLGMSIELSMIMAISTESFYMFSSALSNFRFKALRSIILLYGILSIGYSNLANDSSLKRTFTFYSSQIKESKNFLKEQQKRLSSLYLEQRELAKLLESFRKKSLLSRGMSLVGPKIEAIRKEIKSNLTGIADTKAGIARLKKDRSTYGQLSIANLHKLSPNTYLIFIGLILLQVSTSFFLPTALSSLNLLFPKGNHRRCYAT